MHAHHHSTGAETNFNRLYGISWVDDRNTAPVASVPVKTLNRNVPLQPMVKGLFEFESPLGSGQQEVVFFRSTHPSGVACGRVLWVVVAACLSAGLYPSSAFINHIPHGSSEIGVSPQPSSFGP